jgi:hypothetical protein
MLSEHFGNGFFELYRGGRLFRLVFFEIYFVVLVAIDSGQPAAIFIAPLATVGRLYFRMAVWLTRLNWAEGPRWLGTCPRHDAVRVPAGPGPPLGFDLPAHRQAFLTRSRCSLLRASAR